MPALIESLDAERDELYKMLADPEFYRQEGRRVAETNARIRELDNEITEAYARWEFLESIFNSQPA